MNKGLLFCFLLLAQIVFGQTEKPTKVAGTKCTLVPPPGFIPATAFGGFQNAGSGASIMINELPVSYQSTIDGFTADALKTKGMTLISKQPIDFNGSKATFIYITQPANGTTYLKQLLIFGDSKVTVLVNGIYPETSKEIEAKIKAALLSTVYDPSQADPPLEAASFTVDIKDTDFKLIRYMSGTLLYSTDGKIPTEKPTLIVGNSLAKIPIRNQKRFSEERLTKLPRGEQSIVKEMNEISIDNMKGFEIVAHGKTKDDQPELVYQATLFNGSGDYYIIVGQAKKNLKNTWRALE